MKNINFHPSAMAPTPRVENFEDMGAQRHKPVYAPSFPFNPASNPANLDPKVVTNIIKITIVIQYIPIFKLDQYSYTTIT